MSDLFELYGTASDGGGNRTWTSPGSAVDGNSATHADVGSFAGAGITYTADLVIELDEPRPVSGFTLDGDIECTGNHDIGQISWWYSDDGVAWSEAEATVLSTSTIVLTRVLSTWEIDDGTIVAQYWRLRWQTTTGGFSCGAIVYGFTGEEGAEPEPPPDADPDAPYVPPPPARALIELYLPVEGGARWDVALWDVDTWGASEWTDITPQCVSADVSWGTTQPDLGILAPPEAGKWTITTFDPDRLLDPSNLDSPYYPHVRSLTPIRVTTRGYVVRQGHLDFVRHAFASTDEDDWARPGMLRATDNIAILAGAEVPSDTVLPDTLWARAAAVIAAADVRVPLGTPREDVDVAPWEPGDFRAWEIILATAQEVGYVPYLTNVGMLHFRAWDDPIDRDSTIGSPEMVELAVETSDAGLVSVVQVVDELDGEIERRITPTPPYGRRVHRRDLTTIDGEAYADRILADRGAQALRWRPGAIRPADASAVEWYARREINEIVTLSHEGADPAAEALTRILGGRFYIRDLGELAGPDWRFYFACNTEAAEPLYADDSLIGEPSNVLLVSDDDENDYLYPDGVTIE